MGKLDKAVYKSTALFQSNNKFYQLKINWPLFSICNHIICHCILRVRPFPQGFMYLIQGHNKISAGHYHSCIILYIGSILSIRSIKFDILYNLCLVQIYLGVLASESVSLYCYW